MDRPANSHTARGIPRLGPVLQWASKNLDQQLTVTQLARTAGLSTRTLARRFAEATGTTPLRWLHTERSPAPASSSKPRICR